MNRVSSLVAALVLLGSLGCESTECGRDSDCGDGLRCDTARCVPRLDAATGPDDAGPDDGGVDASRADAGPGDAGPTDGGRTDAGPGDAGPADAGPDAAMDAGPTDAGPPDAGVPDAGPVCTDDLAPAGLRRVALDYETVSSEPFGESTDTSLLVEISETTYASIRFRTPDTPFQRRWVFVDAPTSHNMPDRFNPPTLTVSTCPGDFTDSALCTRAVSGASTTVWLSTRASDVDPLFCRLEPGQEYYLNFVASDAPFTRSPTCNDSPSYDSRRCAVFFSESPLLVDL